LKLTRKTNNNWELRKNQTLSTQENKNLKDEERDVSTYLLKIALNVILVLAFQIKGTNWINVCCVQKTQFTGKDTYGLKVKRCKIIFQANRVQNKPGATLITFKNHNTRKISKKLKRRSLYILIRGETIKMMWQLQIECTKHLCGQLQRTFASGHKGADRSIYNNSREFQWLFSSVDHPEPLKEINKEAAMLNFTIDKMDLPYIYRKFHPTV
jgi:small nuclear ribonucleoprotein (snRNP)-like protein